MHIDPVIQKILYECQVLLSHGRMQPAAILEHLRPLVFGQPLQLFDSEAQTGLLLR